MYQISPRLSKPFTDYCSFLSIPPFAFDSFSAVLSPLLLFDVPLSLSPSSSVLAVPYVFFADTPSCTLFDPPCLPLQLPYTCSSVSNTSAFSLGQRWSDRLDSYEKEME